MSFLQIWVRDDFCEDFREDSLVYLIESLSHHPVGPEDPRVGARVGLLLCQQGSRQLVCS